MRQRAAAADDRCFTWQLPWRCTSIVAVAAADVDGAAAAGCAGCAAALGEVLAAAERRCFEKREKMLKTISGGLVGRGVGAWRAFGS